MITLEQQLIQKIREDIDSQNIVVSEDSAHIEKVNMMYGNSFPYGTADETLDIEYFDDEIAYLLSKLDFLMISDYEKIIMISDSDLPFTLVMDHRAVKKYAEEFVSLPQHKYFFAEDYSWCIFFKMEGYMGVSKPLKNNLPLSS